MPPIELHVVVALAQGALGRLAHAREGLRQQVVERCAVRAALAQLGEAARQVLVGQPLEVALELVDARDRPAAGA